MRFQRSKTISLTVACAFTLSACASGQEGLGQTFGALALGGLCLAVTNGKDKLACIAAAGAGFLIGGAIGRNMDQRDKARREQALRQTLDNDNLWASHRGQGPVAPSEVTTPPPAAPTKDTVGKNAVSWTNPDTKNAGNIELLRSYDAPAANANQGKTICRQFRETYYKQGEPTSQFTTACKDAQGTWKEKS